MVRSYWQPTRSAIFPFITAVITYSYELRFKFIAVDDLKHGFVHVHRLLLLAKLSVGPTKQAAICS